MTRLKIHASLTGSTIGPDDLASHCRAAAEYDVDVLAVDAGFQVEQGVSVGAVLEAARPALCNGLGCGLEDVIVAWSIDPKRARAKHGPELSKTIGCALGAAAPVLRKLLPHIRDKHGESPRDRFAGASNT